MTPFADIKENESAALISRPHGSAQILWREGGMGLQWAVVRFSNVVDDVWRFKLTETLTRCGNALAQRVVYQETPQPNWCELDCRFRFTIRWALFVRGSARIRPDLRQQQLRTGGHVWVGEMVAR